MSYTRARKSVGGCRERENPVCFMEALEQRCLLSVFPLFGDPGTRPELENLPVGQGDISDTFFRALSVTLTAEGSASVQSAIDRSGDLDVLAIMASQTGKLTVKMVAARNHGGVDPYLRLYDADRNLLVKNNNGGGGNSAAATIEVTAGRIYYIQARGHDNSRGDYTVSMTTLVPAPPAPPTPAPTPTPTTTTATTTTTTTITPATVATVVGMPGPNDASAGAVVAGKVISTQSGAVLVVCGTNFNDTLSLSQSGTTITVAAGGMNSLTFTRPQSSAFVGVAIYGFNGSDKITTTYSLSSSLSIVVYGGAGDDKIYENSPAGATVYGQDGNDLIVTVGGRADKLYGGAGTDTFWLDSTDALADAESAENAGKTVHKITSFVQPTKVASEAVSLEISGQNIVDPASSYGYTNSYAGRPLFSNGPQYNDIEQGSLGDCYFLAGLSALAQTDPNLIQQSITALGDGTYAVRFYKGSTAYYYRIDAQLPSSGGGLAYARLTQSGSELWVALLEKAFAQFRSGQNSYASIEAGSPDEALKAITGASCKTYSSKSLGANTLAQQIQTELAAGHAVAAASTADKFPIVGSHAYEVHAVEKNSAGTWYVTVYNPWGVDGDGSDSNTGDGLIKLSADQFKASFYMVSASLA